MRRMQKMIAVCLVSLASCGGQEQPEAITFPALAASGTNNQIITVSAQASTTSDVSYTIAADSTTPVGLHGELHSANGKITDSHGAPIALRGVSLYWSQAAGEFYTEKTIMSLRNDWNINIVRVAVGVDLDGYLNHPDAQMKVAKSAIDAALKSGIYVIVDWHAYQPHPAEAAAFFTQIAKQYGYSPNIIYELWNEPYPDFSWDQIKAYHQLVLSALRAVDTRHLVILGTPNWDQDVDLAALNPVIDPNAAYALHFYAGTHKETLRAKADNARSIGMTLFVSEWGLSPASGDGDLDYIETAKWIDWLETSKISYVNWSMSNKQESSAALLQGAGTFNWSDADISASGLFVRRLTRCSNDRLNYATWPVSICR